MDKRGVLERSRAKSYTALIEIGCCRGLQRAA